MSETAGKEQDTTQPLKRKRDNEGDGKRTRRTRKRKKKEKPPEVKRANEHRRQTELLTRKGFGWTPSLDQQSADSPARSSIGAARRRAKQTERSIKAAQGSLTGENERSGHKSSMLDGSASSRAKRRGRRGGGRKREQQLRDAWSATPNELGLVQTEDQLDKNSPWHISEPVGGRYIYARPLFSADEKHLFLATKFAMRICSISTSLPLRTFSRGIDGQIIGYTISQSTPDMLYIATSWGQLSKWNWREGKCVGIWNTQLDISCVASAKVGSADVIFTAQWFGSQWFLVMHYFEEADKDGSAHPKIILRRNEPIRDIKILSCGKIILLVSDNGVSIGELIGLGEASHETIHYAWKDFQSTESITCCDAKYSGAVIDDDMKTSAPQTQKSTSGLGRLDVVLGGVLGCIYVYEDILNQSIPQSKKTDQLLATASVKPRELHWHRSAVGAVTWSHDGNYIISGGAETVLVLWQLDTGKKQFLPHLESPIKGLNISPNGSSYAVHLADNSVMVLSTSELEPTANFAGLQSEVSEYFNNSKKSDGALLTVTSGTAVIDPRNLNRLFLATPATSDEMASSIWPKPYLQTFDVLNSRHIARQALTRNNATNANIGPNGNAILEPTVTCVQISCDGEWLATVDEWTPPVSDIDDLAVDRDDERTTFDSRREISLRFWSWNDVDQQWQLNSRVMAPHPCDHKRSSGRVVTLQANPTYTGFASIGEDASVRLWSLHEASGKESFSDVQAQSWWAQKGEVSLERVVSSNFLQSSMLTSGALCYSNDGSTIAAHLQYDSQDQDQNVVHFIDADQCQLQESRAGLDVYSGPILGLNFVERFLVCMGQYGVAIWDVTSFELINYVSLELQQPGSFTPILAVNLATKTFAIASTTDDAETAVKIYNIDTPDPLFAADLVYPVLHLLSAAGLESSSQNSDELTDVQKRGYVILDASASTRTLKPSRILHELVATEDVVMANGDDDPQVVADVTDRQAVAPMDEGDEPLTTSLLLSKQKAMGIDMTQISLDKPVVRQEQLAEVFDGLGAAGCRDVRSMFDQVIQLYAVQG